MASKLLFEAVPFYNGLTLDELGGRGVRWPGREGVAWDTPAWELGALSGPAAAPSGDGALRLGTFRTLWASKEVDVSPALHFLRPRQVVELSPSDAQALGVREGDRVELLPQGHLPEGADGWQVGSNGTRVRGAVKLRAALAPGSVFIAEGTHDAPPTALPAPLVAVRGVAGPPAPEPTAVPAQVAPAAEG